MDSEREEKEEGSTGGNLKLDADPSLKAFMTPSSYTPDDRIKQERASKSPKQLEQVHPFPSPLHLPSPSTKLTNLPLFLLLTQSMNTLQPTNQPIIQSIRQRLMQNIKNYWRMRKEMIWATSQEEIVATSRE